MQISEEFEFWTELQNPRSYFQLCQEKKTGIQHNTAKNTNPWKEIPKASRFSEFRGKLIIIEKFQLGLCLCTWNNWIEPVNNLSSWLRLQRGCHRKQIRPVPNFKIIRHVPWALLFPCNCQVFSTVVSLQIILHLSPPSVAGYVHLLPAHVPQRRSLLRRRPSPRPLHQLLLKNEKWKTKTKTISINEEED